jgi:signal transduction histidine kinase
VEVRAEPAPARLTPGPPGEGPFWRIAVHDDGAGIRPDVRERLFDPFFTTKSDGTGLGLAVCQKIAEEHRGAIHVATGATIGTTFTLELPRRFGGIAARPPRG